MGNSKVYAMKLSKVFPLLVNKAVRKGRSEEEVYRVVYWLTGYEKTQIEAMMAQDVDYGTFFEQAPAMNPDRFPVKGSICGVRIETIEEPLMKDIRILDKVIDELAKGKQVEKICRRK
ncbi:MAG: DUF2200 domain-containing protein [Bulleidia sp.]